MLPNAGLPLHLRAESNSYYLITLISIIRHFDDGASLFFLSLAAGSASLRSAHMSCVSLCNNAEKYEYYSRITSPLMRSTIRLGLAHGTQRPPKMSSRRGWKFLRTVCSSCAGARRVGWALVVIRAAP